MVRKLLLKYMRAEIKTQVGVKLSAICLEAIKIAASLSRNEADKSSEQGTDDEDVDSTRSASMKTSAARGNSSVQNTELGKIYPAVGNSSEATVAGETWSDERSEEGNIDKNASMNMSAAGDVSSEQSTAHG